MTKPCLSAGVSLVDRRCAMQFGGRRREETVRADTHEYRLRVGGFRALFLLEGDLISVYAVKDRKEAYE